ncbi:hypothetical protein ON010_g4521 [Phytophthora cinnamomi]|nr:hypothetical protein ON010_g4521 [Phytophthora cinnamomi]
MRRIERSYSIKKKREALAVIDQVGIKSASCSLNIARGTLHDWTKQAEAIRGFTGYAYYAGSVAAGIIAFMWKIQPEWMTSYLNEKETGCMTAVLTVRDDGIKLPILFIIRGVPGGRFEQGELEEYPEGHFYTVQEKAWMDSSVWRFYVEKLLKFEIDAPAVLLLDNFECHVSEEGQWIVAEEANATVVPLPPNSTALCQPLDVGVMGPLKSAIGNSSSRCTGGTAKEKRIRAINSTIPAWESITARTVIRSFEKAIPRYPEVTI